MEGLQFFWASMNSETREIATDLGLGSGFRMDVALPLVYRMLCGMSLELLFKAVIVECGKEPKTTHHRLDEFATDAEIVYTSKQLDLLHILTEAIYWDGRYPVPRNRADWENLIRFEDTRLFDKEPLGDTGLEVLSRNNALDWDSYGELWGIAFSDLCDVADWIER